MSNLVEQKKAREQHKSAEIAVFNDPAIQDMLAMARYFKESNAVPSSLVNEAQIFMVIKAGAEKGMQPVQSLQSFYIVNGRITMWGAAVPARLRQFGILIKWVEKTEKKAVVTLIDKKNELEHTETFTWEDAQRAGLTGKSIWKQYPANMLAFKALGNAVRFFCPHVLDGMYITEDVLEAEETTHPAQHPTAPSNRYGVPDPARRQANEEPIPATFEDVPPPSPEPTQEPTTPTAPQEEPDAPRDVQKEYATKIREGLSDLGFQLKEQWDEILPVLCMGSKTESGLSAALNRVDLVRQIAERISETSISESEFLSALTANSKITSLHDVLMNPQSIEEWHERLFAE